MRPFACALAASLLAAPACREPAPGTAAKPAVWSADRGDGTYENPVLHADYSDPDVIRVGSEFFLTASSFQAVPGLPILRSRDLVSWELVGHALPALHESAHFAEPRHGAGVWAPAIRRHRGDYYIFYGDPDFGIYRVTAKHPAGPWSKPHRVQHALGWIDPCPFWDDDGNAYLVHAFAASRSGIKSVLVVHRMAPDGSRLLDGGTLIFDGHGANPTVEGPKLYKRNGYYYVAAPAGGVERGHQLVLRSRNIYGPYEARTVLAQGKTAVNGPHQGGWVDTPSGEHWFLHFQDRGAYGRVVHLQPLRWENDWPVIGARGSPVRRHRKPDTSPSPRRGPADSDDFGGTSIGPQWQWHGTPDPNWALAGGKLGVLRLFCRDPAAPVRNLWDRTNLLLQKLPGPAFTATAKLERASLGPGERTGLVVMGADYATLTLFRDGDGWKLAQTVATGADRGEEERRVATADVRPGPLYLRVRVASGARAEFAYSEDGARFRPLGEPFAVTKGRWIGAKIGLFAIGAAEPGRESGYADYDRFRFD